MTRPLTHLLSNTEIYSEMKFSFQFSKQMHQSPVKLKCLNPSIQIEPTMAGQLHDIHLLRIKQMIDLKDPKV